MTSQRLKIDAVLRTDKGKGASRRLRRNANLVPGIMYGGDEAPLSLAIKAHELAKTMQQETFYSQIIEVSLDGATQQAVVRDLQRHPASGNVQHIDLLRISANKPIQVSVPLHLLGEEDCVGVKNNGGMLNRNYNEIEISCLPAALPEYIELSVAELDVGDSLHLSDLPLPEGVEIVAFMHGEERDDVVVAVTLPRAATEEEDAVEAAEGEEGEGTTEEGGEAAAEGGDSEES